METQKLQNKAMEELKDPYYSTGKNVYLVPFINFLYYFGYCPFKVCFDEETDKYCIKTHGVQQVTAPIKLMLNIKI